MATDTDLTVSTTAGVTEKITSPDYSDPNFAVFGGAATASTVNIQFSINNAAGISSGPAVAAPYDPNFGVF